MTDHAAELRRHARKIAHPAGDTPAVMIAAAEELDRLRAICTAAHDRLLRGDDDRELLALLATGWATLATAAQSPQAAP